MTLIASVRPSKYPILIGDLLISSKIPPKDKVGLPTIGVLPEDAQSLGAFHIVGTAQKICILNSRLVVAWSGPRVFARSIIRKIKRHFSNRPIDATSLTNFFIRHETEITDDISIICWYKNDKGMNSFGVNTANLDLEQYGHCHIGGSGCGDFINLLDGQIDYEVSQGTPSHPQIALAKGVTLASHMLSHEILTGENLLSYYGGGIEIATFVRDKFQKVGDILHLFWEYDEKHMKNEMRFIPMIYKLDYLRDDLVLRRVVFENSEKKNPKIKEEDVHIVSSLLRQMNKKKINLSRLPDLNASFFCNHVFVQDASGRSFAKVAFHYSPDRAGPFRVTSTDEGLVLSFNREFFANELESVKKGCTDRVFT